MDFMVAFTFYAFTEGPRVHGTNWIDGCLSQKSDKNTAAKRKVPYLLKLGTQMGTMTTVTDS